MFLADGRTYVTKLTIAFRKFAKAPVAYGWWSNRRVEKTGKLVAMWFMFQALYVRMMISAVM